MSYLLLVLNVCVFVCCSSNVKPCFGSGDGLLHTHMIYYLIEIKNFCFKIHIRGIWYTSLEWPWQDTFRCTHKIQQLMNGRIHYWKGVWVCWWGMGCLWREGFKGWYSASEASHIHIVAAPRQKGPQGPGAGRADRDQLWLYLIILSKIKSLFI